VALTAGISAGTYSGGTGETNEPYRIATPNDLNDIGNHIEDFNKCFVMVNDIDLAGYSYSTAVIASDINSITYGFQGAGFEGVFDGNDRTISNLTIDTLGTGNDYLGLFGLIDEIGVVKNLGIEDANIVGGDGSDYLGGLCASSYGRISDCNVIGSVAGGEFSDYLGGLCGMSWAGQISNCAATSVVTGANYSYYLGGLCGGSGGMIYNCRATGTVSKVGRGLHVGGLCGSNSGAIWNCYAGSSVFAGADGDYVGGLCGGNYELISSCYATGSVTGDSDLGGVCGYSSGSISNCYASGSVSGGSNVGGMCGRNEGSIGECYFLDPNDGGGPDNGIGTALTDDQMKEQSSFVGWDFVDESNDGTSQVWQMGPNSFPLLSSHEGYLPPVLTGSGSEQDPWLIDDANALGALFHYGPFGYYSLQSDVNLAGITWSVAPAPVFAGHFDGGGFSIHNLTMNGGGYLGCFGAVWTGASVANLGVEDVNIAGGDYAQFVGGLCGSNYEGTITNCFTTGSVSGGDGSTHMGGLCGGNQYHGAIGTCYASVRVTCGDASWDSGGLCGFSGHYCTISNCYATGSVSGGVDCAMLGGLCGTNSWGAMRQSYATGAVSGGSSSKFLGGLCGQNDGSTTDCYATGAVTGQDWLGGLCGVNYITVSHCYATGSVTGQSWLGGLTGNVSESTVFDCYFLDPNDGGGPVNGRGTPLTVSQMKRQDSFSSWDFSEIWDIGENQTYPFLRKHLAGDLNHDGVVNWADYAIIASQWLQERQ
jgi:hypothetical protein